MIIFSSAAFANLVRNFRDSKKFKYLIPTQTSRNDESFNYLPSSTWAKFKIKMPVNFGELITHKRGQTEEH